MKVVFKSLCRTFLVLFVTLSYGQELPEVIPPSPTVSNIMQFEEVPISHYTGQPNISIPIYSKALSGDLSLSIGLSYNTQGVKIDNRSGWVGTSWSLAAGGMVSRTVRDVPDEIKKNTNGYTGIKTGAYHNTDYWNYDSLTSDEQEEYNWKANGTSEDKYDTELDLYQFNFMGYSGRFVVVKDGTSLKAKQLTKGSNLKIEINNNGLPCSFGTGEIDEIKITDPKGNVYTFDIIEISTPVTYSGSVPQGDAGVLNATGTQEYIPLNTAWHLRTIETSNGENLATFTYDNYTETYIASVTRKYNRLITIHGDSSYEYQDILDNQARLEPEQAASWYQITATTKKVATVSFRDGTSLAFNTSSSTHPETGGAILESIDIKNGSTINKTYTMTYETTLNADLSENRLWLTNINESGGAISLDYELEYENKANLPEFDSTSDAWGYHVGSFNEQCGLIEPIGGPAKTGLLRRIIYPTGGSKEFIFEQNTITYFGDATLSDDEYYDQNPDNWNLATPLTQTFDSAIHNSVSGSTFYTSFVSSRPQVVVYQRGTTGATAAEQFNAFIEVTGPNNFLQRFRLDKEEVSFAIEAGTYEVRFGSFDTGITYTVEMCIGYKTFETNINRYVKGGGVRIKEILFKNDPLDLVNNERRFIFDYTDETDTTKSSGVIDSDYYRLTRTYDYSTYGATCPSDFGSSGTPLKSDYVVTETGVRAQLTQGGYVGYRHVKVSESGNGYNTYSFTSAYDFPSPSEVFDLPHPKPSPNIDFKRGLLLKQFTYNEGGQILKEVNNTSMVSGQEVHNYTLDESTDLYPARYSYKNEDCAEAFWYDKYSSLDDGIPDNTNGCTYSAGPNDTYANCNGNAAKQISTTINQVYAQLDKTTTKEYFYDGGTTIVKEYRKEFTYHDDNFQVKVEDTYYEEKGIEEHYKTQYYYPFDTAVTSTSSGIKTKMIDLNLVNEVLESITYKNSTKLTQSNNIHFEPVTDLIRLQKVETQKGTGIVEERIEFVKYDSYGNPLQVKRTDGTDISYVWGFNSSVPVAKVVNEKYGEIEALSAFGTGFNLSGNLSAAQDDALRSLSSSTKCVMVDTYTYDPVIGVLSGKDVRDYETSYVYDDLNRLQSVKDQDGYLLNKNEYVYGTQSYVKTTVFQVETTDGTTHAITGASLQDDDKIENITYTDELGRALQSITKQAGGNFQDIIIPIKYDDYGRQPKEYLPYADATQSIGSANLNFRTVSTLMTDLEDYYVNKYPEDQITSTTINAYANKSFEASPLSRVLEQAAPGKDWQLDTSVDTDHTIKFEYLSNTFDDTDPTNSSNDNVIRYEVTFNGGNTADPKLAHDGNYKQGELYKTVTKDENWQPGDGKNHTVEEFKDALGRVVIKRTFDAGVAHDTYYVYDDFGNLTYVLSPESDPSASSAPSAAKLDGLCYQYKYDHRNRLIEKKIPGKDWEYIVYDKLDRPVLTQDAYLNSNDQWLFTKYDDFDRVVYTGLWTSTSNRSTLQTTVDGQSTLNEARSATSITIDGKAVYYTNAAYPNTGTIELHTVNYYDDYSWDTLNGFEASYVLDDLNNLDQLGNAVTKNTGGAAWGNAGFETNGTITGDGYVQWTAAQNDKSLMVGLSRTNSAPDDHYNTIDYALFNTASGTLSIWEEGVVNGIVNRTYQAGDVFKVERIGNQIFFKQNDEVFHVSSTLSAGTLIGDSSFYHQGGSIEDVHIGYSGLGQAFTQNAKGLATGSKVRTLGQSTWTHNESHYDDKARPVRIDSKNEYLQVDESMVSLLDFNGKVVETHTSHLNNAIGKKAVPVVTVDKFTYDHTGRLLRQTQTVNDQNEQLLCKNTYDEVGLLSKKQVGGILAETSTYNNISTDISVSGNTISKDTGSNAWNAGLSTNETISGDGYIKFTTTYNPYKSAFVGLNYSDSNYSQSEIDYAIYIVSNGEVRIYESGINRGTKSSHVPGDVFAVERRGSVIYYLKNGEPFYRSTVLSTGASMLGDISIYHVDMVIKDLVLVDLEDGLQDVDYTYNIRGWLKEINDITNLNGDLFAFKLNYNTTEMGGSNAKLYNGNISETLWYTINDKNGAGVIRGYAYDYDAMNRIKEADYGLQSGSTYNFNSGYDLWDVGYDKNGNISGLKRRGENNLVMDELTYTYTTDTNKLLYVEDTASSAIDTEGFDDTANPGTASDYNYDSNGNMILDKNKNITDIDYNHLNLPTKVTFHNNNPATTGAGTIDYVYDATGVKLSKFVKQANLSSGATTYYAGNFVYEQGSGLSPIVLKFFSQPEGYVEPDGNGKYDYVYQFKDHLGNIRLAYGDFDKDGSIDVFNEIIEEHNYYPFGLKHKGYNDVVSADVNSQATKYKYNGKELSEELGLDWYDYGWRNFDASLGRWMNIDPLAERRYELTTYNYVQNSPMFRIDPDGLTDYKLNKKTGEITQVGEANDQPDRIVKVDSKGKIKRFKRGKRKGEAKVLIKGIEKGILKDGINFKKNSNLIAVGGEGQPTIEGVESFALKLSEEIGKEIGGTYFSKDGADGATTHVGLGKYKKNRATKSYKYVRELIKTKEAINEGIDVSNVTGFFHTHPGNGSDYDNSNRLVPSDSDLDFRDRSLNTNPNLKFFIITRPKNPGGKYPYKIPYTKGYSRRLNKGLF